MAIIKENIYSINFNPKKRSNNSIKFIIIHYTGMKNQSDAIKKLTNSKSKVSCHYFIKNTGEIIRMVHDNYTAWHAGKSSWKNYKLLNKNSIGIEIQNSGHDNGYADFKKKQINSLIILLKILQKKFNIDKKNILGHSDIAPERKKDPGEKFPWYLLARSKLCLWSNLKSENLKKFRNQKTNKEDKTKFIKNIYKIGYCKIGKMSQKSSNKYLTKAFQRRFRNELVDGNIDFECLLLSKSLLNN